MSVVQDLYDSEINVSVSSFWDSGWYVRLGDEMNGFVAEARFYRWGKIEQWLIQKAIEHFPESVFAMIYRDGLSPWEAHRAQPGWVGG